MRQWIAFMLCAALLLSPVLAETAPETDMDMEQALTEVTLTVKEILDVADSYTDFSGNYDDYLHGQWYLSWVGEDEELSVTASGEGKIMEIYCYSYTEQDTNFYGFAPHFPDMDEETARAAAEDWLERLLGEGESARIDSVRTYLTDREYRFSGTVLLNGLPSPIGFNLRLGSDGRIGSYSRTDSYGGYLGTVPAAEPAVQREEAAESLAAQAELELYWVMNGQSAELRYVPLWPETVVDAGSGQAVDMEALYASFYGIGSGVSTMDMAAAEAAEAPAMGNRAELTEAELAGIENYAGLLTQEQMDAGLRALEDLGLDEDFALRNIDYAVDSDSGEVTATLRYGKTMTEDELYGYSREQFREFSDWGEELSVIKYISLNAESGQLQSVNTSYPLWELDSSQSLGEERLDEAAEAFLEQVCPERLAQTERCTLDAYADEWVWAQVEQGYFFPDNRLTVSLNAATGLVDSFSCQWQEDVSFGSSDVLSEQQALELYTGGMELTLGYVAWPEELDESDPIARPYIDWGYRWVESLRLAWYYADRDEIQGLEAVSGRLIRRENNSQQDYEYSDLAGTAWEEAVTELASAGIGLSGGVFGGEEGLDMRTAMILLLQANGSSTAGNWDDERLGERAVSAGFIGAGQWKADAAMSGMDFVKAILRASVYGEACRLTGIWTEGLSRSVAEEDLGYAAVAQALGIWDGSDWLYEGCTRAQAAQMLWAFMKR